MSSVLYGAGNDAVIVKTGLKEGAKLNQMNQQGIMGKQYSLAEIREDYEDFRKFVLYQLLPKPFANQDEIVALFKTQAKLLQANMTELEFYRVINPLVVKLRCGHTVLGLSKEYQEYLLQNGCYLPLAVKVIDEKAYVWHDFGGGLSKGTELVSINGRSVKEIIGQLLENITADGSNLTFKMARLNRSFNHYYFNFVDSAQQFRIAYRDFASKKNGEVTLKAITKGQLNKNFTDLLPRKSEDSAPYSSELKPEYDRLKITTFALWEEPEIQKFKAYLDAFFKEVAERKSSNLILDLRDNGGGNGVCAAWLYSYLIAKVEGPYFTSDSTLGESGSRNNPVEPAIHNFKGNLYVLINGGSFSNSGMLAAKLKNHNRAIFVGEESGGSYIAMNSRNQFIFPHTGLMVNKSFLKVEVPVSGLTPGRGIFPDYEVKPTLEDYLNGRDVELEFAVGLIKQGRNNKNKTP